MLIFISYRWSDSKEIVDQLYEYLKETFGPENVFKDDSSIEYGAELPDTIDKALQECRLFIVVIGLQWLAQSESGEKRIFRDGDVVRKEVIVALSRARAGQAAVLPLLVYGATMPTEVDLPRDIAGLSRYRAFNFNSPKVDFPRLRRKLIKQRRTIAIRKYLKLSYTLTFLFVGILLIVPHLLTYTNRFNSAHLFWIDTSQQMRDPLSAFDSLRPLYIAGNIIGHTLQYNNLANHYVAIRIPQNNENCSLIPAEINPSDPRTNLRTSSEEIIGSMLRNDYELQDSVSVNCLSASIRYDVPGITSDNEYLYLFLNSTDDTVLNQLDQIDLPSRLCVFTFLNESGFNTLRKKLESKGVTCLQNIQDSEDVERAKETITQRIGANDSMTPPGEPSPTSEPSPTIEPLPTTESSPTTEPSPTIEPSPTAESSPTTEPSSTNKPVVVQVKTNGRKANLRQEPDERAELVKQYSSGDEMYIIGVYAGADYRWFKLEDTDKQGWMREDNLDLSSIWVDSIPTVIPE